MANLYLDSLDARIADLEEHLRHTSDLEWVECNSTIEGLKEARKMYTELSKLNTRLGIKDSFDFQPEGKA